MGWEHGVLEAAVEQCTNPSGLMSDCPVFAGHIQDEATQNQCQMSKLPAKIAKEKVTGLVGDSLPGGVQIQYGPQPATQANPAPPTTSVAVPTVSYSPAPSGETYPAGVFKETSSSEVVAAPTPSAAPASAPSAESAPAPDAAPSASATAASVAVPGPKEVSAATQAPAPTEAPSAPVVDDHLPIVSTQYITNGNVVSEVVWKEAVVYVTESDDVTVTVTVQPTTTVQAVRRIRRSGHLHRHHAHGRR
jgi:hypothetical protein